jgi:hypothetical protein
LLEFVVYKGISQVEIERYMGMKGANISQALIRAKVYKKIDEQIFKKYSDTRVLNANKLK